MIVATKNKEIEFSFINVAVSTDCNVSARSALSYAPCHTKIKSISCVMRKFYASKRFHLLGYIIWNTPITSLSFYDLNVV